MSRLDEVLTWYGNECATYEAIQDGDDTKAKADIKKLILDEFKEAEYDPWAFAERIEKL